MGMDAAADALTDFGRLCTSHRLTDWRRNCALVLSSRLRMVSVAIVSLLPAVPSMLSTLAALMVPSATRPPPSGRAWVRWSSPRPRTFVVVEANVDRLLLSLTPLLLDLLRALIIGVAQLQLLHLAASQSLKRSAQLIR